jgi:hypothetical protein
MVVERNPAFGGQSERGGVPGAVVGSRHVQRACDLVQQAGVQLLRGLPEDEADV